MKHWMKTLGVSVAAAVFAMNVYAAEPQALTDGVHALYEGWAKVEYGTSGKEDKQRLLAPLIEKADALSTQFPDRAEPLIWSGILLGTQAQTVGGTGALDWAEKAKAQLEKAEKINPAALDGAAYTTLGTLYDKVPGWPLGFGSSAKARTYLQQGVKQNPNGLESNYFYGNFLFGQGQYREALNVLDNAKQPPSGISDGLGVEGRKKDIEILRSKAKRKAR